MVFSAVLVARLVAVSSVNSVNSMAFQTGSQIRPELSAVDYTPFLQASTQASQMAAQGIGAMTQGAMKGFEAYVQNKEKEKQYQGFIKAADTLSSGFEPILNELNPKISTSLQNLRATISNPDLSSAERATAAKAFLEHSPTLLNAGVKFLDTKMMMDAKAAESRAKAAQDATDQSVISDVLSGFLPGKSGEPSKFTADTVPNIAAQLMVSGVSPTAMSRIDSALKLMLERKETKTEVDKAYDLAVNAFTSQNNRAPTDAERSNLYTNTLLLKQNQMTVNTGQRQLESAAFASIDKERGLAQQAANLFPVFADAKKIVDSGKIITGAGANVRLQMAKILAPFGINEEEVSNSEVLQARLAIPVMSLVRNLGSGAGITEKDVQFVESTVGRNLSLEPESIKRLIDIGNKISKTTVDNYQSRLNATFPEGDKDRESGIARRSLQIFIPPLGLAQDIGFRGSAAQSPAAAPSTQPAGVSKAAPAIITPSQQKAAQDFLKQQGR